jgi:glycosyltransferase Alg8
MAYLLWILSTRLIASMILGLGWGRVSPLWPLLLYYNQVGGAALKSFISFRFNQQTWTRQNISSVEAADPRTAKRVRLESALLHAASVAGLVAVITFATGALHFPDRHSWQSILAPHTPRSDDYWLTASLKVTPPGAPVLLPAETINARWQTFEHAGAVHLRGAGADRTVLRIAGARVVARRTSEDGGRTTPAAGVSDGAAGARSAARRSSEDGGRATPAAGSGGPRQVRCGQDASACQIDGRVRLSNLTLTIGFPP